MKRTKTQLWKGVIGTWEKSGKSQRDFCKAERIAFSTFQYWRKRLFSAGEGSKFVRVVSTEKTRREISISFEEGIRMTAPDSMECETLSRVIRAVNEALCVSTGTR